MKKFLSAILILSIFLSLSNITAAAADVPIDTRASTYFSGYYAFLSQGTSAGEIKVSYSVSSSRSDLTQIGVSQIKVYCNGTRVKTIIGTVVNGLMVTNATSHSGTYTIRGDAGASYYTVVTVKAMDSSTSATHDITTNTVTAPTK